DPRPPGQRPVRINDDDVIAVHREIVPHDALPPDRLRGRRPPARAPTRWAGRRPAGGPAGGRGIRGPKLPPAPAKIPAPPPPPSFSLFKNEGRGVRLPRLRYYNLKSLNNKRLRLQAPSPPPPATLPRVGVAVPWGPPTGPPAAPSPPPGPPDRAGG